MTLALKGNSSLLDPAIIELNTLCARTTRSFRVAGCQALLSKSRINEWWIQYQPLTSGNTAKKTQFTSTNVLTSMFTYVRTPLLSLVSRLAPCSTRYPRIFSQRPLWAPTCRGVHWRRTNTTTTSRTETNWLDCFLNKISLPGNKCKMVLWTQYAFDSGPRPLQGCNWIKSAAKTTGIDWSHRFR